MTDLPATYELGTEDGRLLRYCLYGPPAGVPAVFQGGSPSTRWRVPEIVRATEESGVRLLVYDRPGYGGSTRQPGRTVADAADDVRRLAAAQQWERFAVAGVSGGGPHALACAALLAGQVTRCVVASGIAPPLVDGPEPTGEEADPRRNRASWLAAQGEGRLRPALEEAARQIMAGVDAGGPEFPPDPSTPTDPAAPTDPPAVAVPARDSPESMARLTATFVTGLDGWVDDNLAFVNDWGFRLDAIDVPVSLRYGDQDDRGRQQAAYLQGAIATAEPHPYRGGHSLNDLAYRDLLSQLRA